MASDVEIVNGALSKLGEQPVLSFSDRSEPARIANRTYADIRDALLREFTWNFATKRTSLAADTAVPDWGYDRQYTLPADFLRLIEVNNASDYDWRLESGKILTDLDAPLQIRYVARVLENAMDATFREALASRLAMEWAEPLSQTTSVGQQMSTLYRNKLQVARTADGQEDRQRVISADSLIDSRF